MFLNLIMSRTKSRSTQAVGAVAGAASSVFVEGLSNQQ